METQTVKLPKALPNMSWQLMLRLVVMPKLREGRKDLGDPMMTKLRCTGMYYFYFYCCTNIYIDYVYVSLTTLMVTNNAPGSSQPAASTADPMPSAASSER